MDTIDIISALRNNDRAEAIQKINDLLYHKAADAMQTYKGVVARTFFDTPEDYVEEDEEISDEEES